MNIALVHLHSDPPSIPWGLMCVASWVRREVPSCNLTLIDGSWEDPLPRLLRGGYEAVGIGPMTSQYETAHRLARLLKVCQPSPVVLIGGVHITTCPASVRPEFDIALPGEGESALTGFLRGLPKPSSPIDLGSCPDLDFAELSPRYFEPVFSSAWGGPVRRGTILTSRGCPYDCRFCSTTRFWGHPYRLYKPEWVIRQVLALVERGVTHLEIWDDLFICSRERLIRIAELWEAAGLHRSIRGVVCQGRANLISPDVCDALRRMRVAKVGFGFESGNDRVLTYLKKSGATVKQNRQAVLTLKRHGLKSAGTYIVGSPTETWREMWGTVREIAWMVFTGVDDVMLFGATPYPGTDFWSVALRSGRVSETTMDWNSLKLHTHSFKRPMLCDLPLWQYIVVYAAFQFALLPLKLRKVYRGFRNWISRL